MGKKILGTLAIVLILISVLSPFVYEHVWNHPVFDTLDAAGQDYLDDSLVKAAAAYALARGANGIISVVQESDLQATLLGTGVTVSAGQILDPVNDLIERFSWIMLASVMSLGVQQFAVELGIWLSLRVLLPLALIAVLIGLWWPLKIRNLPRSIGVRLVMMAVMIRFFIPLSGWANEQVYQHFLFQRYQESIDKIDLEEIGAAALGGNPTAGAFKKLDLEARIEALKDTLTQLTQDIITLIVVFFIQTMVLPLATMWIFLVGIKALARWSPAGRI